jgi:hypothetical protein
MNALFLLPAWAKVSLLLPKKLMIDEQQYKAVMATLGKMPT